MRPGIIGIAFTFVLSFPATLQAQQTAGARDSLGKPLGSITAAIARDNEAAARSLNLVARIETRANEMVEFYEPAPGLIIVSGAGAPEGAAPPYALARSPIQVWRLIAGDAEPPAALRDALGRAESRGASTQRKETAPPKGTAQNRNRWGGGSLARNATRAAGFCDAGYYEGGWHTCEDFYDFKVCVTNWRDGIYAYHHDTFNSHSHVCPASGRVAYRITSNEFDDGFWTVDQHTVRWINYADTWCANPFNDCPYLRADVEHAAGVRFHFQFMVEEE